MANVNGADAAKYDDLCEQCWQKMTKKERDLIRKRKGNE
jgi:hypothetical protein